MSNAIQPTGAVGPRTLGRYELCARIATGGMAEVYLARHGDLAGLQTLVVIKRILPHLAADPAFIGMFLDEARIAAHLDHPNVARTFEVGRAGDEYFLALELVQGESLATLLDRAAMLGRPVPHRLIVLAAAQAAAGLHHAHTARDADRRPLTIVHRDVSPSNLLISFDGAVKVIDFGVARAFGRLSRTHGGSVKGTFAYMSPEQARGLPVDARSDVFSLGIALWEAVCGRRLFDRDSALAAQQAIMDETPAMPSTLVELSTGLERVILRCLEKDPARRFGSAQEMQIALEKDLFGEGGASARELGQLMRAMLPDHYQRWQSAVAAARPGMRPVGDDGAAAFDTAASSGAFDDPSAFGPSASRVGAVPGDAIDEHDGIGGEAPDGDEGAAPFAPLPTNPTLPLSNSGAPWPPSPSTPPLDASPGAAIAQAPAALAARPRSLTPSPIAPPILASAPPENLRPRNPTRAVALVAAAVLVAGATAVFLRSGSRPGEKAATAAVPTAGAPPQATLFLITEPRGANILLDGAPTEKTTPAAVKVKPGKLALRFEKAGYEPQTVDLALAPGDERMIDRTLVGSGAPAAGGPPGDHGSAGADGAVSATAEEPKNEPRTSAKAAKKKRAKSAHARGKRR